MPPPNSTAQSPTLSHPTATPYFHQLELISSPVPDLAATLSIEARAHISNHTLDFLRTRPEGDTDLPLPEERYLGEEAEDSDQGSRWDNHLTELQNIEWAMSRRRPISRDNEGSRYANRIPHRQSLYDWAPGSDEEDLYHELLSRANLPTFAQSARPPSRHLNLDRQTRPHSRSRIRPQDELGNTPLSWAEAGRRGHSPPQADSSASTAALLQSVEQHRRFNARARSTLQSYILERDRRNNDAVDNIPSLARLHHHERHPAGSPYPVIPRTSAQADLRNAHDSISLDHPALTRLKSSIHYLSKLRHCDTLEEGLTLATDLADGVSNLSDLIVDTTTLPPIPECSWLTPGTVFTGSQHTPRDSCPVTLNRDRDRRRETHFGSERIHLDPQQALQERHRRRSHTRIGTYRDRLPVPDSTVQLGSSNTNPGIDPPSLPRPLLTQSPSSSVQSDHWPVTITFHDVSYSNLTLSGTMSAMHIPNKISPHSPLHTPNGRSMRSFFEGEIIDFRTHTLETESFCTGTSSLGNESGLATDARYWRGIGPFRELVDQRRAKGTLPSRGKWHSQQERPGNDDDDDDDDEAVEDLAGGEELISAHLRSRSWIQNVLLKEWVLMRWKERCFIPGQGAGGGIQHDVCAGGRTASIAQNAHAHTSPTNPPPPFSSSSSSSAPTPAPDPSSWGLTISGFYYVALRRQTGQIDGLYYDPGSLPFQVLDLRPQSGCGVKGRWPAQQFR